VAEAVDPLGHVPLAVTQRAHVGAGDGGTARLDRGEDLDLAPERRDLVPQSRERVEGAFQIGEERVRLVEGEDLVANALHARPNPITRRGACNRPEILRTFPQCSKTNRSPRRQFLKNGALLSGAVLAGGAAAAPWIRPPDADAALMGIGQELREILNGETVNRILIEALIRGGDYADIFAEQRFRTNIVLDDGKIDSVTYGYPRGAGVRVYYRRQTGYAFSDEIQYEGLLDAARVASNVVQNQGSVRPIDVSPRNMQPPFTLTNPIPLMAEPNKFELVRRMDTAARAVDKRIVSVRIEYLDDVRDVLVGTSDGVYAMDRQYMLGVSCVATAVDGTTRRTGLSTLGGRVGTDYFSRRDPETVAREAAQQAITLLTAVPAPAGAMPVVIAPGWGGVPDPRVLRACTRRGRDRAGHVAPDGEDRAAHRRSRAPRRRRRALAVRPWLLHGGRRGRRGTADRARRRGHSPVLHPRSPERGLSQSPADRERTPADLPQLAAPAHDEHVHRSGEGRPRVAPLRDHQRLLRGGAGRRIGRHDERELQLRGPHGYLIENGKLTSPVRGAVLIGNSLQTMERIEGIGNDLAVEQTRGTCGKDSQMVPVGVGQPTVRFSSITVGGTAI
jgi:TldD protein